MLLATLAGLATPVAATISRRRSASSPRRPEAVAAGTRPAREGADFAKGFGVKLPADRVADRLLRPIGREPFVDAYVRWQLTSFRPDLPRLDDRSFERLLESLPTLPENPRANRRHIDRFTRAQQAGTLDPEQLASAQRELAAFKEEVATAWKRCGPALRLRAWLQMRLPKTGVRAILVRGERCVALVNAGWPVDDAKGELAKCCTSSASDPAFSPADRRRIGQRLARLDRLRRPLVTRALVQNDAVVVQFGETAVYDFEVRRWTKSLQSR